MSKVKLTEKEMGKFTERSENIFYELQDITNGFINTLEKEGVDRSVQAAVLGNIIINYLGFFLDKLEKESKQPAWDFVKGTMEKYLIYSDKVTDIFVTEIGENDEG